MRVHNWATSTRLVHVIGTVGRDEPSGPTDDVEAQARRITERIDGVLAETGTRASAIVRMRVYPVDMAEWPDDARVLDPWFSGELPPATVPGSVTLVEPWMRVEVEVDAEAPDVG